MILIPNPCHAYPYPPCRPPPPSLISSSPSFLSPSSFHFFLPSTVLPSALHPYLPHPFSPFPNSLILTSSLLLPSQSMALILLSMKFQHDFKLLRGQKQLRLDLCCEKIDPSCLPLHDQGNLMKAARCSEYKSIKIVKKKNNKDER